MFFFFIYKIYIRQQWWRGNTFYWFAVRLRSTRSLHQAPYTTRGAVEKTSKRFSRRRCVLWKTQVDPLPRAAGLSRGSIMQICCALLAWPVLNRQAGDRYQRGPDLTASVCEIIDSRDECSSIGDLSGVQRLESILTTYKICLINIYGDLYVITFQAGCIKCKVQSRNMSYTWHKELKIAIKEQHLIMLVIICNLVISPSFGKLRPTIGDTFISVCQSKRL